MSQNLSRGNDTLALRPRGGGFGSTVADSALRQRRRVAAAAHPFAQGFARPTTSTAYRSVPLRFMQIRAHRRNKMNQRHAAKFLASVTTVWRGSRPFLRPRGRGRVGSLGTRRLWREVDRGAWKMPFADESVVESAHGGVVADCRAGGVEQDAADVWASVAGLGRSPGLAAIPGLCCEVGVARANSCGRPMRCPRRRRRTFAYCSRRHGAC